MIAALVALVAGEDPRDHGIRYVFDAAGWRLMLAEAFRHGVAPIAWARLSDPALGLTIPHDVAHDFERSRFRANIENLRLFSLLGTVLRTFRSAGIDALVLKGAYLADAVYRNRALRWMADADVMVRRTDLARAARLLNDLGWRSDGDGADLGALMATGHQLPLFERAGARIELHWNIEDDDGPFAVDVDGLWERAVPARIAGADVLALGPEDLLLHLCLHAAYGHGWLQFSGGLRHLYDITATIACFGTLIDWDVVTQRAAVWGTGNCTWLALVLADNLLAARVPAGVLARLAPPDVDARVVETARYLALRQHYAEVTRAFPALSRKWLTVRWCVFPPQVRVRRHLLPGRASLAQAYPSLDRKGLAPLRYVAHWRDLTRDWMKCTSRGETNGLVARERARWDLIGWMEASASLPPTASGQVLAGHDAPQDRGAHS